MTRDGHHYWVYVAGPLLGSDSAAGVRGFALRTTLTAELFEDPA